MLSYIIKEFKSQYLVRSMLTVLVILLLYLSCTVFVFSNRMPDEWNSYYVTQIAEIKNNMEFSDENDEYYEKKIKLFEYEYENGKYPNPANNFFVSFNQVLLICLCLGFVYVSMCNKETYIQNISNQISLQYFISQFIIIILFVLFTYLSEMFLSIMIGGVKFGFEGMFQPIVLLNNQGVVIELSSFYYAFATRTSMLVITIIYCAIGYMILWGIKNRWKAILTLFLVCVGPFIVFYMLNDEAVENLQRYLFFSYNYSLYFFSSYSISVVEGTTFIDALIVHGVSFTIFLMAAWCFFRRRMKSSNNI
ncbi:hypothetical protein IC620_16445 [Hazenella sp. IB182357]|uniref:Uncharacterized protein n=1 Tax=Polycladospora coralii TaxID=2771432 RepID=A0A926RUH3_9BACL|nr:hypothetical protein [Polycladospora coralii]MBD1373935.1 hypothetical protein [Polycladospora coralii]